jgi:hypothetical protein
MMRFRFAGAVLALLLAAPAGLASAQDMERMIVTANRVDASTMRSAPAVYRRIPADFVLVAVTFQSATRDEGERQKELETMFKRLKTKAAQTDGIDLSGGRLGSSTSDIETVLFTDIYANDYNGAGRFTLTLSVDTREGESFENLVARAEDFVMTIKVEGRAEAYLGDEQFIGARDVTKHRSDLMADIANEVAGLRETFGAAGTKVTLTGLENRIITQPSGPLELEIFIPYTLVLETSG